MAYHWRLKDIPELRGLPESRRRRAWSEAVSRSATPRAMLLSIMAVFVAALASGGMSLWLLPALSPLWSAVPAVGLASLACDALVRAPAARRWLREHAAELDRCAPG